VVSEILGKKIKLLTDREIIKAGIDAVADSPPDINTQINK
jgi:hypothetical protein